jgi:hypothetical protein
MPNPPVAWMRIPRVVATSPILAYGASSDLRPTLRVSTDKLYRSDKILGRAYLFSYISSEEPISSRFWPFRLIIQNRNICIFGRLLSSI